MCRSIVVLRGHEVGDEDVRAAALQYVRKISGYRKPSQANTAAFEAAIEEIALSSRKLLSLLQYADPRRPVQTASASLFE